MVTLRLLCGMISCLAVLLLSGGHAIAQLPKPVLVIDSPGATRCVDVSDDGKLVAAGGDKGKVFVWDAQTGKLLCELDEAKREVSSVRFTNAGKTLVTNTSARSDVVYNNGADGRLIWWDLETRKPLKRHDFSSALAKLQLSPDGKMIATSSGKFGDKTICLYDAVTGKLIRRVPNREDRRTFAFSPDSKLLAIASKKPGGGSRIEVWDLSTDKVVMMFEREYWTTSLAISNDGKTIACCGYGLTLHRMKDGAEIARDEVFGRYAVDRLLYAREGKWLLGWKGGGVMVFDGETLKRRRTEAHVYNKRGGVALSRDGKVLATVGEDDDEVKLWRVDLWE